MCSHAHVNKRIMVHFQPRTHIQWHPFDCISLLSAFCRPKTIFPQMLATTEQKPYLEQSTSELSKCLTVLSDAGIRWYCCTKRTCVDVSDAPINVASSDHQCCGSCMALAWLLLLCQLGCQKRKVFQCCCRSTGTGSSRWLLSLLTVRLALGKITKVLVISIIVLLVLVSFCWIILVII